MVTVFCIFNAIVSLVPSSLSELSHAILFSINWFFVTLFGVISVGNVGLIKDDAPTIHDQKLRKLFDHYSILLVILMACSFFRLLAVLGLLMNEAYDGFIIFRMVYSFFAFSVYLGLVHVTTFYHGFASNEEDEDSQGSGEPSPPPGNH